MNAKRVALGAVAVIGLLTSVQARVQVPTVHSSEGILTITVTGEAEGKPDTAIIALVSEAVDDNGSDAFRLCKERAEATAKAIDALHISSSQVVKGMYEIVPAGGSDRDPTSPAIGPAGEVRVSRWLAVKARIVEKDEPERLAETILRVWETANKNGMSTRWSARRMAGYFAGSGYPGGPIDVSGEGNVSVLYMLEDATKLQNQAIADAFEKAKGIKEALGGSGVKAGRLISVDYQPASQNDETPGRPAGPLAKKSSAFSLVPDAVTVRRSLVFRYALQGFQGK